MYIWWETLFFVSFIYWLPLKKSKNYKKITQRKSIYCNTHNFLGAESGSSKMGKQKKGKEVGGKVNQNDFGWW